MKFQTGDLVRCSHVHDDRGYACQYPGFGRVSSVLNYEPTEDEAPGPYYTVEWPAGDGRTQQGIHPESGLRFGRRRA